MKPGDFVLELLKDVFHDGRTIVLMRHSARNSFYGVPQELREAMDITSEGVFLARAFGESLQEIIMGNDLFLGHTVARRCRMTAEAIADGFASAGRVHLIGCQPEIESPVVNMDTYVAIRNEIGGPEGIRRWLDNRIPEDALQNPRHYADKILRSLVSFPVAGRNDLLIVVAHDITLFPIISTLFDRKLAAVEFLNGIVITAGADSAEIRYSDADFSLKTDWKIG